MDGGLGQGGEVCPSAGDSQHGTVAKCTLNSESGTQLHRGPRAVSIGPAPGFSPLSHEQLISEGLCEPGWKLAGA